MVITGENVKSWHTDWMYQDVEAPGGGVGDERRVLFMERNLLGESCIRETKKRSQLPPAMSLQHPLLTKLKIMFAENSIL